MNAQTWGGSWGNPSWGNFNTSWKNNSSWGLLLDPRYFGWLVKTAGYDSNMISRCETYAHSAVDCMESTEICLEGNRKSGVLPRGQRVEFCYQQVYLSCFETEFSWCMTKNLLNES